MDAPAADRGLSVRLAEQPAEAFEDRAVVPGRRKTRLAEPARPAPVGQPSGERPRGEPSAAHAAGRLDGKIAGACLRPLKVAPLAGQHAPCRRALDGVAVKFRPQPLALDVAPNGAGLLR